MKLALLLLALFTTSAQAAPRILQNDWELGGGFNLTHVTGGGASTTAFTLSTQAQYFLADHFSLGIEGAVSTSSGVDVWRVGPVATKYLFVNDNIAPYLSILPIMVTSITGNDSILTSKVRIGTKFFLTDSVAFGPAIDYEHLWENDQRSGRDGFSFLGLFSIHL